MLPQLPRLVVHALQAKQGNSEREASDLLKRVLAEQRRTNMLLGLAVYFGGGLALGVVVVQLFMRWYYLVE